MSQTTYLDRTPLGKAGMRADAGLHSKVDSFVAEDALTYGLLVEFGTDPETQVKAMIDQADENPIDVGEFPGFVMYEPGRDPQNALAAGETVSILRQGRIWVSVTDAVTAGDPVYVCVNDAGGDTQGECKGADSANYALLNDAWFVTSAAADGLAIIEIK